MASSKIFEISFSKLPHCAPVSEREIRYRKGEFLAIRNTDDGFFLCQTARPIIGTELQTQIRWLTQMKANSDTYNYAYHDFIDSRCILTNVRLTKIKANKYRLPQSEKERSEVILWASIAAEKRGHSAPPTCQGNRDEVEAEIINLQSTLAKKVRAEGANESKERSPRENSFRNITPGRETRGAGTENARPVSTSRYYVTSR